MKGLLASMQLETLELGDGTRCVCTQPRLESKRIESKRIEAKGRHTGHERKSKLMGVQASVAPIWVT